MELFHECKNRYFRIINLILYMAKDGITRKEIEKIIQAEEYEDMLIGKDFKNFSGMLMNDYEEDGNFNILKEHEGKFFPIIDGYQGEAKEGIGFTDIEKRWLKMLIKNPIAAALLGGEITEKLQIKLEDIDDMNSEDMVEKTYKFSWEPYTEGELRELREKFFIITDAISKEKNIRYSNMDRQGNIYKDKVARPIRIEYSIKDDRIRVSMYISGEKRTIMANIHTMSDIEIIEENEDYISREDIFKRIKEDKYSKEPIVLQVKDERAAMERCFMAFSGQERTARIIEEDLYEINLNYYVFQEDEVIRKIIALGPYVKVISPKRVIDEVVVRIKKTISG